MAVPHERYCPICGRDVDERAVKRLGESFCSEAHAEEFLREVRERAGYKEAVAPTDEQVGTR